MLYSLSYTLTFYETVEANSEREARKKLKESTGVKADSCIKLNMEWRNK